MDKKNKIRKILQIGNLNNLNNYNKNTIGNVLIDILNDDIDVFSYEDDKDMFYLENALKLLPIYLRKNPRMNNADEKLKNIHQNLKKNLVQKPGDIDKSNKNYKLFKNLINEVEMIQMSIMYDYIDKYEGSKYELIDYIIFELKNISVFNDALNRFPFLVNYFDKDNKNLIVSVTDAYIDEVLNYSTFTGPDNITYFDQVIHSILKSEKFRFDVIDKQTILKKIKEALKNIDSEKEKKTFYLNSLIEIINDNEHELSDSASAYKYDIPTIFNEAINSEVRQIKDKYSIGKEREYVDDYVLSFDGEDAKEIDDSLSIKVLDNGIIVLGVHIADPLYLIDENSIIFEEAVRRTTSIYLSDKTIPMFPPELSTDLVSLKAKKSRPATSYYFTFDKHGNVIDYDFKQTIIEVNRNMTYDDFNHVLNMNSNEKLKKTVDNLSIVSNILQRYYNLDPLYGEINRNHNNITNTNIIGKTSGEKMVESAMIFTNYMVAKHFLDNDLPFIFRNHQIDPDVLTRLGMIEKKIIKEDNNEAYLKYIDMVKNIYPKAYYGLECVGHQGLGIKCYTHITSPLRRMADVIGLLCLNKLYFSDPTNDNKDSSKKLILLNTERINKKRNPIERFENEHELRKASK